MNDIGPALQSRNPRLSDLFADYHPFQATNPLGTLSFSRTIDRAVTRHLGENPHSPFDRIELGTEYAKKFHFHFFLGLLAAAHLKPDSTITRAYTRETENALYILVLTGRERAVLHLHKIYMGKMSNPSAMDGTTTSNAQLRRLITGVEGAEHGTGDTISIGVIENHEYELVPQSTTLANLKVGLELKLLKETRVRKTDVLPSDPYNSFVEYEVQPKLQLLDYFFRNVWNSGERMDTQDFSMFLMNALGLTPRGSMPVPELTRKMSIAGFLHGNLLSALPDSYYNKILSSPVPHIHFTSDGVGLYFPPTSTRPHQHFFIDTNYQNINVHVGYDLFPYMRRVGPETTITEYRYVEDLSVRLDPYVTRTLRWSVENLIKNMNSDIFEARGADVPVVEYNVNQYSRLMNEILSYRTTRYDIRTMDDFKYFLIGSLRNTFDKIVSYPGNERATEASSLLVQDVTLQPSNSFVLDVAQRQYHHDAQRPIHLDINTLVSVHNVERFLKLEVQYDNSRFELKPISSLSKNEIRPYLFTFGRQGMASDLPITESMDREFFHVQMDNFFRDLKTFPKSFYGAYMAGVFQQVQYEVTKFNAIYTHRKWEIRAELLIDGQRIPYHMQLFKKSENQAAVRALRLGLQAEGKAIVMTYNLRNDEDGLAVMALADEHRHLNTDNVNALCNRAVRKKRASGFGPCGGKGKVAGGEDKISYEDIERKAAEKFPNLKADLAVIHELTGKIQLGFIGRDILGDYHRRDWNSLAHSTFFFGASVAGSKLGSSIAAWGAEKAETGEKFIGRTAHSFGLCLPKIGFDIYMGNQLFEELKINDTESASYTSAYIGLDLIECGLEALEAFGLITFSSILTPLLAVLGTSILIAQNFMQTVRKIDEITAILPLTVDEKVYEFGREFLHFGTDSIIKAMEDEVTANELAALKMLEQYPKFGRFLISAAAKTSANGSLIFIDDNIIDLTRKHAYNKSRLMPRDKVLGNTVAVFCALDEANNPNKQELESTVASNYNSLRYFLQGASMTAELRLPQPKPYTNPVEDVYCENAFGIIDKSRADSSKTLYLLFNGTDNVIGDPQSENIFLLMNGNKSINGGYRNDHFFIQAEYIYGYLNGSGGEDVVDFSASDAGKDLVIKNGEVFFSPRHGSSNTLKLYQIESIIGRSSLSDYIEVCNETKVDLSGATYGMDRIILTNNCARMTKWNLTVTLRKNTFIKCDSDGLIQYIVANGSETDLILKAGQHQFLIESADFKDVSIRGGKYLWTVSFPDTGLLKIRTEDLSNIGFIFKKQNLMMKFDGQNRTLYLHGNNDIFDIIENYADYVENNVNVKIIARSEQGMIVLNHNLFRVDFEGKTRLLNVISNGRKPKAQLVGHRSVENYFSITWGWGGSIDDYDEFNITIHPQISESIPCYIDLHNLTQIIHEMTRGDYGLLMVPKRIDDDIKLLIIAHSNRESSINEEHFGEINIIGGYKFMNQITVYLYTKNIFSTHSDKLNLRPPEINVNNSIISILPGHFEFYSQINFNHSANNVRAYRMDNTILLSNIIPMDEANNEKPITVSLIDYFDYEAKYQTLSLSFVDRKIDLKALADNAEDMRFMWMDISDSLDLEEDEE